MKSNHKAIAILTSLTLGLTLFTQCKKQEADIVECTGVTPTYTSNVKAIMNAHCATSGCHNASSKKSGYDLSSYESTKSAAGNKAFVASIQHNSRYSQLPQGASKLSDAAIKTVACWVQNGMPN